jgi:hypothetical protein
MGRRIEYYQMKSRIRDFLRNCETIDFGKAKLSKAESVFYRRFSNEIFSFCRSLPLSAQTDAMFFLMKYSGLNLGDELDFFANYYSPTWSIIYWLTQNRSLPKMRLKKEDVKSAITGQSMAMFLHSLDDHLSDHQFSISPLNLLLRSQAWTIMNRAFCNLAEGVPAGERTVRNFIDEYYSSVQDSKGLKSIDDYCDLFRRQMGIGMVAPILLSMKMTGISDFTGDIQIAYGSFGIAWRLLDDIKDLDCDIKKGASSAIYFSLPEKIRTHWKNNANGNRPVNNNSTNAILSCILENSLIDKIKERICTELDTAASLVGGYKMIGLAHEFRCLACPLRKCGGT